MFGTLTKHFVSFMFPPSKTDDDAVHSDPSSPRCLSMPLLSNGEEPDKNLRRPSSLEVFFRAPTHTVHYFWRKFDNAFMRPVFGGRGFVEFVPGTPREDSDSRLV